MRTITLMMIVALFSSTLAGCVVRTRDHHSRRHHNSHVKKRDCPPAYHWNGRACVHNGRGKAKGHRR